ncbi:MAG: LD-carboxypeptidase [Anaerolineales bacterium]|nr:LD-carboxypeptidase [Anaerolineales bacterium]
MPGIARMLADDMLGSQREKYQDPLPQSYYDAFDSSPITSRVADIHAAFADPKVKGILTAIGGYNSNQLLRYLDYDLIRANPQILCVFSDITALGTAIYARTGMISYSGPHFSTFGMER